jgi:hypothetical protein
MADARPRKVVRAALVVLLISSLAAWFAFSLFQGGASGHDEGARHWASAPVLALGILFAMGCLILLATLGPRGRRAR